MSTMVVCPRRLTRGLLLAGLIELLLIGSSGAHWDGPNPYARDSSGQPLYAIRMPNVFYHNVGLLEIMVTNVGVIGNPGFVDSFGAGWRGGEYLFAGSLWFGAIASDNLSYVSTGAYENELLPGLGPLDTIYPSFEGVTGGDRAGFSASGGDDDQDGLIDEDPQNGRDDDGDGHIDEDFEAISQQMYSCQYWDYTEEAQARYPEHRPLYVHITQRSFAWSTQGANEFVGFEYDLRNDGFESLRDIYIGYFVDSDAGRKEAPSYWNDDGGELRSVDTTYTDPQVAYSCTNKDGTTSNCSEQNLHIDIAFMHDTPGSEPGGNAADDMGAGADGYFGGMFLGHTTDPLGERAPTRVQIHTCHFFSGSGTYPDGDPRNDYERYDLLSRGTKPRRPTSQPSDYRYCFSAGRFSELLPGERLKFQVAFVIGNEWRGLLHNAITAQRIYNGQWRDTDADKNTGCNGNETCVHIEPGSDVLQWHDPCDSLSPSVPIKNTTCEKADYWKNMDCSCCTPIQTSETECEGLETLVHWVWEVAPPPPALSTEQPGMRARVEQDRRIHLEWDNTSELVVDPSSQKIFFCGYRVWRVEGWNRPIGSTGPSPVEWQLVADLTRYPVGSQLDLADYTNEFAAVVDSVPMPSAPNGFLERYEVGRYFFEDEQGLKNGMIYFYDVTAYSCWYQNADAKYFTWAPDIPADTRYVELASSPAATEAEGVRPLWGTAEGDQWQDGVFVVPNPWRGGAEWDLTPSASDPTGSHIDFAGLPDKVCDVRIYTIAGDLVQTLQHDGTTGSGTARWNMISRNGQDIVSGIYLYAMTCDGETKVGRFTIIR
jgi:hypothetical protein